MALKLIREAQTLTSLSQTELTALQTMKQMLGKETVTELVEAFRPTANDYKTWLATIIGYAKDSEMSINRRNDFMDVAGAVLENDPANPPYEMQSAIMSTLWTNYKASKNAEKVNKLAQAAEDEEQLNRSMQGIHDDQDDEFVFTDDETNPSGMSDEGSDETFCQCPRCNGFHSEDEECKMEDTVQHDSLECPYCGKDIPAENNKECCGELGHGVSINREEEEHSIVNFARSIAGLPQRRSVMTAKPGDTVEPKSKVDHIQQTITSPSDEMNKALKSVSDDGEAAWKGHQLPKNPHPPKSMAARRWDAGLKKAMKDHLGITASSDTKNKTKRK